ncbi:hypothetical protein RhiirA5_133191 [Rhizophagus irregularis]|uniref:Uncharacterized protein n=1 Tax=Rhizophagus irregularis TaxID=588596 RepID=A0A2N0PVC4_9GLOM|nr:hypothetical protein RhiirA5_133191 [Rhizophagus irregularis]GET54602.1 hypothetical protein RIR_jg9193.t1 [Rhizophagus irregularis DAOM 181602=DAOM 197198]
MQNDNVTKVTNSFNNSNSSSSNFNSVTENHGKSSMNEEMDCSFHEKVALTKKNRYQRYHLPTYLTQTWLSSNNIRLFVKQMLLYQR